ncbi:uncharacterized protein [Elaeis guineensis]|uniref:uncharacterized protein isoform X2 n=1 Tax=Elaeis guineensis var. tenera TaxID=51953 RepID=UPI00057AD27E
MAEGGAPAGGGASLKDHGNEFFKAGNYLKAAALYTQAIKLEPNNPTLYSNRAAAFLHLVKLNKALCDAEMTITLNPQWEKGYFRRGCVLEAMERYDDAVAALQVALQYNPQSVEISKKIKRLTQLAREKKRAEEVENIRSNVDMGKYLEPLKLEFSAKFGTAELGQNIISFLVGVMESAIKAWHETGKVDPRVNFLLDKQKTRTDKYAPVVNIDKVWKGQGSRKWKLGHSDGFFVQFESPVLRKVWFVSSSTEKGRNLCRNPEALDISAYEVFPRLFKEPSSDIR